MVEAVAPTAALLPPQRAQLSLQQKELEKSFLEHLEPSRENDDLVSEVQEEEEVAVNTEDLVLPVVEEEEEVKVAVEGDVEESTEVEEVVLPLVVHPHQLLRLPLLSKLEQSTWRAQDSSYLFRRQRNRALDDDGRKELACLIYLAEQLPEKLLLCAYIPSAAARTLLVSPNPSPKSFKLLDSP